MCRFEEGGAGGGDKAKPSAAAGGFAVTGIMHGRLSVVVANE
jgi:hypothetical protein